MWLFDLSFFLNSANLICRDTDISKYFRESLGLRDNESRLHIDEVTSFYIILLAAKLSNDLKSCIISSCKKQTNAVFLQMRQTASQMLQLLKTYHRG